MSRPPRSGLEALPARTLHVAVDLQRLFATGGPWMVREIADILAPIRRLAAAHPSRSLFARFIPADRPEEAGGRWRRYYERWADVTGDRLDPAWLDLVPDLASTPCPSFDKRGYSIFSSPEFLERLATDRTEALVLTGVETDVCVLGSLYDAVDRGLRVVLPVDAVASGSRAAHDAVLGVLLPRLPEQVDLTTTAEVLAAWPAAPRQRAGR